MSKDPAQFPLIIQLLWMNAEANTLQRSSSNDPLPDTQFVEFPNRRTAERCRFLLVHYRGSIKRAMMNPRLSQHDRQHYGRLYSHIQHYAPTLRNCRFPEHSGVARGFYNLPDGEHRVYFRRTTLDVLDSFLQHQISSDVPENIRLMLSPRPPEDPKKQKDERIAGTVSDEAIAAAERAQHEAGYSLAAVMADKPKVVESEPISEEDFWAEDPADTTSHASIWCPNCNKPFPDGEKSCPHCPTSTSDL